MTDRGGRLSVVVLTSIPLGVEVVSALRALPEVGRLTLLTAPPARRRSILGLIRDIQRFEGTWGLLHAAARLAATLGGLHHRSSLGTHAQQCPKVAHFAVPDFNSAACRARLRELAPDLGVVVGTRILGSDVFAIPRFGCINLHLGAAPEFRGSSPGFYEMLQGVPEAGVTIHRVTDIVNGGNILLQERFPLEVAPEGDPIEYLGRYLAEVLGPNGIRLMATAVAGLARGTQAEVAQNGARAATYRRATYALKGELRLRVAERQAARRRLPSQRLTFTVTDP
jgi:folate-dependent phosphoribosylglycinamide formyltransferase PurN